MLTYKTPEQLEKEQSTSEQAQVDNNNMQNDVVIDSLAGFVRSQWEIAKTHKIGVTERLSDCLRRRKGEYSPNQLAEMKGNKIYMKITSAKIVGAKAWLSDLFNTSGDKPFTLEPTPVEDLPPEIHEQLITEAMQGAMQLGLPEQDAYEIMKQHEDRLLEELRLEAEQRMEKMEDHIHDTLVEGGWRKVFEDFLDDFVTYPTAVISGVNFKNKKQVKWVDINGEHVPKEKMTLSKEFNRVSPFDSFPSPNTKNGQPIWFCERVRFSPEELANARDLKGYSKDAIFRVLTDFRFSGHKEWLFNDNERDILEQGGSSSFTNYQLIDGVKYSGSIQGSQLTQWGMKGNIDPVQEYQVQLVVIGGYTIRAIINPDPSQRLNYYCASWRTVPNSFWGEALCETIADIQDAANATARSLINNMAIGASPIITYDVSKALDGKIPSIEPFKVYAYDSSRNGMSNSAGVNSFKFDIHANELLGVYERFVRYADEISGIPSYAFGSDSGAGAAKTASGLSMLMNAAGKNMKNVVRNIDINIIEPVITNLFNINMLDPNVTKEIKGDCKVKARGSDALMHKESMAMRQQELLQMTNNPTDMQLMGLNGRRDLFESVLKNNDLPSDRILFSKEELMQNQQSMMQQPQPEQEGQQ